MPNKVDFNKNYPDISESNKFFERSEGLIPAYSQLLAKGPEIHKTRQRITCLGR
jgi:hypothetical protein